MPLSGFCPQVPLFPRRKRKERTRHLLPKALPTVPADASKEREVAGSEVPSLGGAIPQLFPLHPSHPSSLLQGVRIPTLGSFDVVPAQKQVGTETVTIQRPVFRLSRTLRDIHNLMENEDDLSGRTTTAWCG